MLDIARQPVAVIESYTQVAYTMSEVWVQVQST